MRAARGPLQALNAGDAEDAEKNQNAIRDDKK